VTLVNGDTDAAVPIVNEVRVVGRLAAPAFERQLPSGDQLVVWRVVVPRAVPPGAAGRRTATVDTLDCVSRLDDVRERARSWSTGDVVDVSGALRRRFWRGAAGPVSRCEIEVRSATRLGAGDPEG
jgi:single-strand DNA-binding protein